ncbi:MAG TPA: hypothetical protein VIJ40_09635 [Acidimicrobiales bacterium]
MIWFVWRQFRVQSVVALGTLFIVAAVAFITGPHLAHLYATNVATCGARGDCTSVRNKFFLNDSTLRTWFGIVVIAFPGIIGMFWGAPLVAKELEAGTHRLVWTQSVTRTRWLAAKLGVVGLASVITAGLLSLVVTWWASPLDRAAANIFGTFDERNIVPIGYAAFAFVLGVTAGVIVRRTVPAMASTLVAFVTVRLSFDRLVRPHLVSPTIHELALKPATMGFGSANGGPFTLMPNTPNISNAWIYSTQIFDKLGHALTPHFVATTCPRLISGVQSGGPSAGFSQGSRVQVTPSAQKAFQACVTKVGEIFHIVVTSQPANHYWLLQWYEMTVYIGAAIILASVCFWWVRRRLS